MNALAATGGAPSKCRSCGAAIRWAITAKGISQPIDFEPDAKGNLVIFTKTTIEDGHTVVRDHVRVLDPLFDRYVATFMAHHATCPNADRWRR